MAKRQREDSITTLSSPTTSKVTIPQPGRTKAARVSPRPRPRNAIACALPPHPKPIGFASIQDYELHYEKFHLHACHDCGKNFPTPHMLSLHITENHDPIVAARRARGDKIYACLVEGCDKICSSWRKRKLHVLAKHGFPEDYDFLIVDKGMGARRSMLRRDWDKWHKPRAVSQGDIKIVDGKEVDRSNFISTSEDVASEEGNENKVQAGKTDHNDVGADEKNINVAHASDDDVSEIDTSGDEESEGDDEESEENDDDDDGDDDSSNDSVSDDHDDDETEEKISMVTKGKGPQEVGSSSNDKSPSKASKQKDEIADLAASMSALAFVPRSVRFGRGGRRGLVKR